MKDRIQPATRFPVPIAFITLSLLLGLALCAQGGDGFGVGVYHENIRTGSQDMGLKFKRGSELGTYIDFPPVFLEFTDDAVKITKNQFTGGGPIMIPLLSCAFVMR